MRRGLPRSHSTAVLPGVQAPVPTKRHLFALLLLRIKHRHPTSQLSRCHHLGGKDSKANRSRPPGPQRQHWPAPGLWSPGSNPLVAGFLAACSEAEGWGGVPWGTLFVETVGGSGGGWATLCCAPGLSSYLTWDGRINQPFKKQNKTKNPAIQMPSVCSRNCCCTQELKKINTRESQPKQTRGQTAWLRWTCGRLTSVCASSPL